MSEHLMGQFDVHEQSDINERWTKWLARLERLLAIKNITLDPNKLNYLFYYGGEGIETIFDTYKETNKEYKYPEVVQVLTNHFNPKINYNMNTVHFRDISQHDGESFDEFVARLREKAKLCRFDKAEKEICLQIVHKCASESLKRRLMEIEDLELAEVIKLGKLDESINTQIKELKRLNERQENKIEINKMSRGREREDESRAYRSGEPGEAKHTSNNAYGRRSESKQCFKCGGAYPHEKTCPARDAECRSCKKLGHFAKLCKARQNNGKHVRQMNDHNMDDDESSNVWTIRCKRVVNAFMKWFMPMITLLVCQSYVKFMVDTGAEINLIDEETFNKLKMKPCLRRSNVSLFSYGSRDKLKTLGEFNTRISYNGQYRSIQFIVTSGKHGNLLSYQTSVLLGIVNRICSVSGNANPELERFSRRYPSIFSGKIGLLKNYTAKLHIDKSVKPVQQRLRQVPFHLRPLVEKEIQTMLDNDIIEPVSGPTPWISPIVPVPKPGKNEIRICTDAKLANKAILRSRHTFPTIEDLVVKLNGAKFISKFDLRSGYNQIMIDPESRYITAFCTHLGIFQYKRLNFGINASSEIFQKAIEQVLAGLEGALNFSDDIIVFGSTKEEHDENLAKVFERLENSGLTVNESKCEFGKQHLKFFGLEFSKDGVLIDRAKKDALICASPPSTASEVRSLLGLANYCARFIPDFSTTVKPLRELTKKGVRWSWTQEHQKALDKLKETLSSKALNYFDPTWRTEITVDASPVGLAAVMAQYDPKQPSNKKLVMYASRSLSPVEQRYSQVEREALAVVWACERFHLYVYAKEFDIITDNKAVELIFGSLHSKPKARIERWGLRLLPYKFVIKHKPGASNVADYMSRNPQAETDRSLERATECYINMLCDRAIPKAITRAELLNATLDDQKLAEVTKMLRGEKHFKIPEFEKLKQELSCADDGLILRGSQIVVPEKLQKRIIAIAHSGHMGMVKTKQLVRGNMWFPGIDSLVESEIKKCHKCQINTESTKFEPLSMSDLPNGPWELLSIDFYGPLRCGKYLLVLICEYSRYPIVKTISGTSASIVIPVLRDILATFGIPECIKSDNGPPFNSFKFKQFAEEQGFRHRKITPLWPRANGMCERFMKNLGKIMRNSSNNQKDWEVELVEFLSNYRAAPHSSTGVPPQKLLLQTKSSTSKISPIGSPRQTGDLHLKASINDDKAKNKMKSYADQNAKAQVNNFKLGELVLLRNMTWRKSDPLYEPMPYTILGLKGSMVTAGREGRVVTRNCSFFKRFVESNVISRGSMFGCLEESEPEVSSAVMDGIPGDVNDEGEITAQDEKEPLNQEDLDMSAASNNIEETNESLRMDDITVGDVDGYGRIGDELQAVSETMEDDGLENETRKSSRVKVPIQRYGNPVSSIRRRKEKQNKNFLL